MKHKKMMALILTIAMTAGSSMVAFAADTDPAEGATGTGTLIPHLDKDVITVTLPTSAQTANVFNFTVDPEQLIKDAEQLTDGTGVTGNEDGVYFKNAGTAAVAGTVTSNIAANTNNDYKITVDTSKNAEYKYDGSKWQVKGTDGSYSDTTESIDVKESDGTTAGALAANDTITVAGATAAGAVSYSSSSDAIKFAGQNSVDVDVTVVATVEASAANAKDIALVADEAALTASKVPALYMTLTAGTDTKAITTANGATAKAVIAGAPENFEVRPKSDKSGFEYGVKAGADQTKWKSTTVQLSGKTNKVSVPTGDGALSAPKIKLTWTVAKHVADEAPSIGIPSYTVDGSADVTISVNLGAGSKEATGISSITFISTTGAVRPLESNLYSLSGTTLTIKKDQVSAWIGAGLPSREYTITFNDTAKTAVKVNMTKR